jgi:ABC-2 type transport system ATP-binding protein
MIAFESVTKKYGTFTAVDRVTFTVAPGGSMALLGPNGAGKTTLVRMLMGFSRPTGGTIRIDGVACQEPLARKGVGYLAERHQIPPHLTGRQYLLRHAALCGLRKDEAAETCDELLEKVGMAGRDRQKARTYSQGMSQRLGLAAAMTGNPKLLVLDEPTTGLDPLGIREVREILERLRDRGVTVLLNSHLLSEVARTCDSAAVIHKGRILLQESLDDIARRGQTLEDVFVQVIQGGHA